MTRSEKVPEYRFIVPGKAESFRSRYASVYKKRIKTITQGLFPAPQQKIRFDVLIDYFHLQSRRFDMDNVAKCVLDALNGVAYADDQQVRRQVSEAHDLRRVVILPDGPIDLIKPLKEHDTYLFVRVRNVGKNTNNW